MEFIRPPRTSDGRPILVNSSIADALEVQHTGSGDDITNGTRLEGALFKLMGLTTADDHEFEWQYLEYADILGGTVRYSGALNGDFITYELYAPASPATSNPGAGVFDKYPIGGGINMFVPNATNEGDWDLDLEETLNENVVITKVSPIPFTGQGFFDYNPGNGAVSLNPSQEGDYQLFDTDYVLSRFINRIVIYGDGCEEFVVPASYSGKRLLPHWKHRVTVHKETASGSLSCWWRIFHGREVTRPF